MISERNSSQIETVIHLLKEKGCVIVKENEKIRKGNKVHRPDLVGYTITEDGKLTPQVVVEIKSYPTSSLQQQIMENTNAFGAPFGLLVVGSTYYWFDSITSLPIEAPEFHSSSFIENVSDITNLIWNCLNELRGPTFHQNESLWIIANCLLIRAYLYEQNSLTSWDLICNEQDYLGLTKAAYNFFDIRKLDDFSLLLGGQFDYIRNVLKTLCPISPISPATSRALIELFSRVGEQKNLGHFVTPESVRNLIIDMIRALHIHGKHAIDLATGYSSLIHNLKGIVQVDSFIGIEIGNQVAMMAQIISKISGDNHVHIKCSDSLRGREKELHLLDSYSLTVFDGPFGKLNNDKDLTEYSVTQKGKRSRIDISELFIEKAIRLTKPGGHIVALVPESILYGGPMRITRDFIKDQTIIEAIISLPAHSLRPYTGIKTSILVLRKKVAADETSKELFLGNPESVDDFEQIVTEFTKWRNGGEHA